MRVKNNELAQMSIDMKRSRFRIFKNTLEVLGHPAYIQFLINPEELFIAVLGSDKPIAGGTANRIRVETNGGSVEFYSSTMLNAICSIYGDLDYKYTYHLTGEFDSINRVAYFSLRSIKRIERRTLHATKRVSEVNDR